MLNDLKNAFRKPNNALAQVIIINVIFWIVLNLLRLFLKSGGNEKLMWDIFHQIFLPSSFGSFIYKPWTIITSGFSHLGFGHIFWNMIALYWFGMLISEYLNSKRLISMYILGVLAGGLAYLVVYNFIPVPKAVQAGLGGHLLGASAGVYAVVVGAATLMPNYSFHLIFIGPVRIKYIAAIFILLSIFGLVGSNAGGDLAHLGGALMGYGFIIALNKGTDLGGWIHYILDGIKGLFVKKSKMKVTYRKSKVTANAGNEYARANRKTSNNANLTPDQAEIDAILDKISASGYESLSKEEKQRLFNASKDKQ